MVEISFVAELAQLPVDQVEKKLGDMILKGTIDGTLHRDRGLLFIIKDPITGEIHPPH